jgi:hypothetical protein
VRSVKSISYSSLEFNWRPLVPENDGEHVAVAAVLWSDMRALHKLKGALLLHPDPDAVVPEANVFQTQGAWDHFTFGFGAKVWHSQGVESIGDRGEAIRPTRLYSFAAALAVNRSLLF